MFQALIHPPIIREMVKITLQITGTTAAHWKIIPVTSHNKAVYLQGCLQIKKSVGGREKRRENIWPKIVINLWRSRWQLRTSKNAVFIVMKIALNTAGLHSGHQKRNLVKQAGGADLMQAGSVSEVINFLFKKSLAAGKDQVITLPLFTRYLRIVTDHTPRRWLKEARGQEHRKAGDTEEKICMAINISWLTSHVAQNKYLHNKAELPAIRLHIPRHTWVIKVLFTCLYPQKECKTVWILIPTIEEHRKPFWKLSRI